MAIMQCGIMSSDTDDSDTSSSSDEELPLPPPPILTGKVMCWCKRCVGMVSQHAYIVEEHIIKFGRHDSGFPGASSSGQVFSNLVIANACI
jgi:hypothetical protein